MKFLFGTNFQNQQVGAGTPGRVIINKPSDVSVNSHSVTADGYTTSLRFLANSTSVWTLTVPNTQVASSMVRHFAVEFMATSAWSLFEVNAFGYPVRDSIAHGVPVGSGHKHWLVAVGFPSGKVLYYVNKRLVLESEGTLTNKLTISRTAYGTNANLGITISKLAAWDADTNKAGEFIPSLVDYEVDSINEWYASGESFVASINKREPATNTPLANTYVTPSGFVVDAKSSGTFALEVAGRIEERPEEYSLRAESGGKRYELFPITTATSIVPLAVVDGPEIELTRGFAPMIAEIEVLESGTLALQSDGDLEVFIDGTQVAYQQNVVNSYPQTASTYATVLIYGEASYVSLSGSALKNVLSWGNLGATRYAFYVPGFEASSLVQVPSALPTNVNSLQDMFRSSSYNGTEIVSWDITNIVDADSAFRDNQNFNQSIGNWNTKGLNYANYMFSGATAFNQDLSRWGVDQIPEAPLGFDAGADSWTLPRPRWGEYLGTLSALIDLSNWQSYNQAATTYACIYYIQAYLFDERLPDSSLTFVSSEDYSTSYGVAQINANSRYWCTKARTTSTTTPPSPRVNMRVSATTRFNKIRIGFYHLYTARDLTVDTEEFGTVFKQELGTLPIESLPAGSTCWIELDVTNSP